MEMMEVRSSKEREGGIKHIYYEQVRPHIANKCCFQHLNISYFIIIIQVFSFYSSPYEFLKIEVYNTIEHARCWFTHTHIPSHICEMIPFVHAMNCVSGAIVSLVPLEMMVGKSLR